MFRFIPQPLPALKFKGCLSPLCLRDNLGKLFSFYRHVIQDTERKGTCIGSVVGDRVPLGWTSGVCQGEQNQALFTPSHSKDKASGQS